MQFRSPTACCKERMAASEIMARWSSTTSSRPGQVYRIIATRFATKGGWTTGPRPITPRGRTHERSKAEEAGPPLHFEGPGRRYGGGRGPHHPFAQGIRAAGEDPPHRAVETLRAGLRSLVHPVRAAVRREEQVHGAGRLRGDA